MIVVGSLMSKPDIETSRLKCQKTFIRNQTSILSTHHLARYLSLKKRSKGRF